MSDEESAMTTTSNRRLTWGSHGTQKKRKWEEKEEDEEQDEKEVKENGAEDYNMRFKKRPRLIYHQKAAQVMGPAVAIPLPLNQNVSSEEDKNILYRIDQAFSVLPDLPKIFQKRITSREDSYLLSYSWKYDPHFYLNLEYLTQLKSDFLLIDGIMMNPTGGTCSKESNFIIGIATPCYCDWCEYERTLLVAEPKSSRDRAHLDLSKPRSPEGSYGRFIIKVKKSASKTPVTVTYGLVD